MNISIHPLTYVFLLISFLSGYFEYVYLLLLIIFIHESGHYFFSRLVRLKVSKIVIYPFGGITILNAPLNTKIYKEFISLVGGIIFQLIFYYLIYVFYINNYVTYHVFNIVSRINYYLICFNFMPVIPLDGGRLLNLVTDMIFNYKLSYKVSLVISLVWVIIFIINNSTVFGFILFIFLIKSLYLEFRNIDNKYSMFLFERYKDKYYFRKIRLINDVNKFKRSNYHIVDGIREEKILSKMFDKRSYLC